MRAIATSLLCLAAAVSVVGAGQMVLFDDGRGLPVRHVEIREGLAILDLADGGSMTVPAERIVGQETVPDVAPPEDLAKTAGLLADDLRVASKWRAMAGSFADLIESAATRNGVDPALLTAVVKVESNFDPFAVSSRGACGLAQLLPATAKRFETTDVFDAAQNLEGGARYLRWLLDRFDGRVDFALAGYNAGEGAVDRHRGIPPYLETLTYVLKVLDRTEQLVDSH